MIERSTYVKENYKVDINPWSKGVTRVRVDIGRNNPAQFIFQMSKWVLENTKITSKKMGVVAFCTPIYFTFDDEDLLLFKLRWC